MIISGNVYIFLSVATLQYCLMFIFFESPVHPVRRNRRTDGWTDRLTDRLMYSTS